MTHPQTFHSPPALWGNRMAAATGDSLVWAGQMGLAASGYSFRKVPETQAGKVPEPRITVYPNPARTHVYVGAEGLDGLRLGLYNQLGQTVLGGRAVTDAGIDVSRLPEGLYFYVVEDRQGYPLAQGKILISK